MTQGADRIYVRSHVARDLLQSAALFKTDKLVTWEYVSNGLQYVDPGTAPVVQVRLNTKARKITVADNGRGMDWPGLKNFFVMHGENVDRKRGAAGRGRFGTGKSAAFGIADLLRITSVRNGRRSSVELSRREIEAMSSEDPIPVRTIEREIASNSPNGTVIEIEGVHLRSLDQAGIIRFIEQHLARWPKNATVFVNNHECEFHEPPIASTHNFTPEGRLADTLGAVQLIVRVGKSPLDEDLRGVSIFSKGVWYETSLCGNEGREMSQYLFGEIDVPRLDEDNSPIPPFDMSRSMKLNPSNPTVQAIYSFVGEKLDEVRRKLVEADKRRKETEEAKRLQREASEIARVINEDFEDFRRRLAKVRAKGIGTSDFQASLNPEGSVDLLASGGDEPTAETFPPRTEEAVESPSRVPLLEADEVGLPRGKRERGDLGAARHSRGGFQVEFDHMGSENYRAHYVPDERTIYVNLDHPQLEAARGMASTDDPSFRRVAYEVAFSEYAIALASELANRDEYLDPSDPIVDIRETMNRLARKGARLYQE